MRRIALGLALLTMIATLGACSSNDASAADSTMRKHANTYAIEQLEVDYHHGISTKNMDMLMSVFADDAVVTLGGQTYTGTQQIRNFFATAAAPMKPENHWVSETLAWKTKITVDGDKGTLYFECHYTDVDTRQLKALVGADNKVARINDKWLITNLVGTTVTLST
jgi:ketosteroid isomerase-like protein